MSYEKERAIAEAASIHGGGWDAKAQFMTITTPQFVLGLLEKLEWYEAALKAITRRAPIMGSMDEYRRGQLDALEACREVAKRALNPTEANGCADCRREGRCDVHLRLDIEATEANDDHE